MHPGHPFVAALCAVALAAPLGAVADTSAQNYYAPPKLVKRGTPTSAVAGAGTVVVKVLVNKDGSFKVQGVIRSTNHEDDAAALEIAKSSKYQPASRGGQPLTAFYDFTLKFNVAGQATTTGDQGDLARYEKMLHAADYKNAQTGLKSYLDAHPGDARAEQDLGVADAFLGESAEAVAAFDKGGDIPTTEKAIAAKAYSDYAVAQANAKANDAALGAAKKAVALSPVFSTYNTLGFAEFSAGDYAAAIADLEKARALGQSENSPAHQRALVAVNLVSAYLAAGNVDSAKAVAAEVTKLDPSDTGAQNALANYFVKQAQDKQAAGKPGDAAPFWEQAAQSVPAQAGTLYAQAALAYLRVQPKPDNDKAKADADKALAADPSGALANFAAGIVLANQGKTKEALDYLNKADAAAKKGNDPSATAAIENAIKQLNGTK